MKKITVLLIGFFLISSISAQKKNDWSYLSETERIVKTLASDEMAGRKVFTEGNDKAAAFIADEFKKAGLQPWDGKSFFQPFTIDLITFTSASAILNGEMINEKNIFAFSKVDLLRVNDKSVDFDTAYISKTDTFFLKLGALRRTQKKNLVVFVDTSHQDFFNTSKTFHNNYYSGFRELNSFYYSDKEAVVILTDKKPERWSIEYRQQIEKKKLQNVVGVLPGKNLQQQEIVFSAHYDHLGIGKPNNEGDSIYNGANDDASGTTAVIILAKYFKELANNERTIVFAAFTAEEMGFWGSIYFSHQFDPSKIAAMFNIEMIGTESKWGKDAAYISGYEKSDMGAIMQKNLEGTGFTFYRDPYPQQGLFTRADNVTLAKLGVPAHTISTARMEAEPNYHKVSDEVETLDLANMAMIIESIALSSISVVNGKDTPTRIVLKK